MSDENDVPEFDDHGDDGGDTEESDPGIRTDGGGVTTSSSTADHIETATQPAGPEAPDAPSTLDGTDIFSGVVDLDEVLDFYLDTNPWGVQPRTVKSYGYRLRYLRSFCDERGITDLREFRATHTDEYHNYLRAQPQLGSRKTVKDCLGALRKFFRYCERREVFDLGFHELVILPNLSDKEGIDETWLPREDAEEIVDHLATFEPFTREHVAWALIAETGIRQSTLYAFDLEDYDSEERYIEAVNREETGTRLKNGDDSEREISISSAACQALDGYIQAKRDDVRDDHGRQPLLTTREGRLHKSTIRKYVYAWSRPCAIGKECPVDKNPETCPAAQTHNDAYQCPESVSPHPVRKGYITHLRANGIPTADVISDRCDVDPETIDKWYDMCMESERREARRPYVEGL